MAEITLQDIAHPYDPAAADKTYGLNQFDMRWVDGGRYAILGPSGCSKTTMLVIMTGILRPPEGRFLVDGVVVTDHTTAQRNITQVFQFPLIYVAMTVQDNLAFPLVCRGKDKAFIKAKVNKVSEVLNLKHLLTRSGNTLTANQKQLILL